MLKPLLRGSDLRPWFQAFQNQWLIVIPAGWTSSKFGNGLNEHEAWLLFQNSYPAIGQHLLTFEDRARNRYDKGEHWWELRACDYYDAFDKAKIFWPDISKTPRFSWDTEGFYCNDKGFIAVTSDQYILGILQSRAIWFCISNLCVPLGERAGLVRYQQKSQFISQLPIPDALSKDQQLIGNLAEQITHSAKSRYQLHQQVRHRVVTDLGTPGGALNNALTAWWELDFPALRNEVKKVFKQDIPLKERHEWELYLADARQQHQQLTQQIISHEIDLNRQVYALFHLTPDEIALIEASTKYPYGEV